QTAFRTNATLYEFLEWPLPKGLDLVTQHYSVFVPRSLALKIKERGPDSALARQFLPHESELKTQGLKDPIGDQLHSKAPQLIHRYQSRALFTPTTICPVHC